MRSSFSEGDLIAGRYQVRGRIAAGPAYVDYRVFDREADVELSLWWMDDALWPDEGRRVALEETVRELRALSHPNLRRVFAAGRADGGVYLVSQIGRPDVAWRMLSAAGGPADLLRYAADVSAALEAAHATGLVHGHLCPVDLVEVSGQIKVSGVGLYRQIDRARLAETWGQAAGYLAPEVLAGGEPTIRSDVYSLAAVLAALPQGGDPAVARILAEAMVPAPAGRPASPAELVRRLGEPAGADPSAPTEEVDGAMAAQTVEENSPLFLHPEAAPSSRLFGPNAPTVLGHRARRDAPPPAEEPAISGLETVIDPPRVAEPAPVGPAPAPDAAALETVIESGIGSGQPPPPAPGGHELVVPLQSHMPPPEERAQPATPVLAAIDRPDLQPVLRSISDVRRPSTPPRSLGYLAPPRSASTPSIRPRPIRGPWIALAIVALAVATGALILALLQPDRPARKSATESGSEPGSGSAPGSEPETAPPEPVVTPMDEPGRDP